MSRFKGRAEIHFPRITTYIEKIAHSLTAHNMVLREVPGGYDLVSTFGTATVRTTPEALHLTVEAVEASAFNRLKHDFTGLIQFVARDEPLEIVWTGDATGDALPPDLRVLMVGAIDDLSPHWRRITFQGDNLGRYANPDQIHGRLLFQAKGVTVPEWPKLDDHGRIVWPKAGKLSSRIYTIRSVDVAAGLLTIDFFVHAGHGPGIDWVRAAAPGDIVGILGPAALGRQEADWYLFAGDETGLPGIARLLESLPETAQGVAFIEVGGPGDQLPLSHPSGVDVRWLYRGEAASGTTRLLPDAVLAIKLPREEKIFCWVGTEYAGFRAIRNHLRQSGVPSAQLAAFSHWRKGMSEEDIVEAGASSVTD